ncbi:8144_t:CDS:1, partial [Dentiscutata erythropus]
MSNKKAPGESNIPYEFWKYLDNSHLTELCSLFNKILDTKQIPKDWNHSNT